MSTDPKFKCSQCKNHKVSNEFGTRQVCGLHAQKGARLFKFVKDNIRDETRRTLPKTNERDRRNQPLPENITGRQFGTFTRRNHAEQ
jgi:hypothetical protein